MGFALDSHRADEIFHEDRAIVGLLRDMFFVRSFEEGVDLRTSARFNEGDEILDPDRFAEGDLQTDIASLVVGPAGADRLVAGAEGGDGHGDSDLKRQIVPVQDGVEAGLVVDKTR